ATSVRRGLGHACASGAAHGGFLAVGWLLAFQGRAGWWGPALRESVALIVASVVARLSPAGAVAYLLVPLVVARDAAFWPGPLDVFAGRVLQGWRATLVGAASGAFLGLHLLFAASLMLGYHVEVPNARRYLAAVAYDVGANALTVEWLFRGGIFSTLW